MGAINVTWGALQQPPAVPVSPLLIFLLHKVAQHSTPNAFQRARQPQKLPPPVRYLDSNLKHASLGQLHKSTLQRLPLASWLVHPFFQCSQMWPTNRHTQTYQTMLLCL